MGFGLGSKCGNPSTNTLKKTKTKIVGAICTLTYSVTRLSDVLSVRLPQGILSTPFNQF